MEREKASLIWYYRTSAHALLKNHKPHDARPFWSMHHKSAKRRAPSEDSDQTWRPESLPCTL